MKKFITLIAFLMIGAVIFAQDVKTTQIAFGAIKIDSTAGGAPAGGTATYYYFNTLGTRAGGLTAATQPISTYRIGAVTVNLSAHSAPIDSAQITLEISSDNVNWYKYKNTVTASTIQYKPGSPLISGAATYSSYYVQDWVKFTGAASGCMFMPNDLFTPYLRIKVLAFKAATYAYVKAYVTLVKIK